MNQKSSDLGPLNTFARSSSNSPATSKQHTVTRLTMWPWPYYQQYCRRCTARMVMPCRTPPSPTMCYYCRQYTMEVTTIDGPAFFKEHPYVTDRPEDLPLSRQVLLFLDTLGEPGETSNCAICIGALADEADTDQSLKVAPCGHVFHRVCLGRYLDNTVGKCPYCRRPIRPNQNENAEANAGGPVVEDGAAGDDGGDGDAEGDDGGDDGDAAEDDAEGDDDGDGDAAEDDAEGNDGGDDGDAAEDDAESDDDGSGDDD